MDSAQHLAAQVRKAFGTTDLYAILEVSKDAAPSMVKKAYMKAALKYHPDKGGEAEKFQALSVAHAILSDSEKRKVYDESGLVEDFDEELDQNFTFWYDYFRKLTPKVTAKSIEKFQEEYIGSADELNDVVAAFVDCGGDVSSIMDSVMFAEVGHEKRICDLIDQAIKDKLVKKTALYAQSKKTALDNMPKRVQKKRKVSSEPDLALMIAERQQSRAAALGNIFSKYGGDGVEDVDIPDELFEKARAKPIGKGTRKKV